MNSGFTPINLLQYSLTLVLYIALGFWLKSILLNWIVGPLFLVTVLYIIPSAFSKLVKKAEK